MVKGTQSPRATHYHSRRNGGDTTELWAALQKVLILENVEFRPKSCGAPQCYGPLIP
jgi:hypothetical protein